MTLDTKKLNEFDDSSSPEARSHRIRRVRNLANLDRKEMCNDGTINFNTLKGWENAKYGGLPADGAKKIAIRVAKEGVICTTDWLLYGTGQPPNLVQKHPMVSTISNIAKNKKQTLSIYDEIEGELVVFQNTYKDVSYMLINDDGMEPLYIEGEYVAGINYYGDEIVKLIGKNCIIKLVDGNILLRRLSQHVNNGIYRLICLNPNTKVQEPTIYQANILSASPVIRHYRKK